MLAVRLWTRLGHRVLVEKRTTAGLVERWVILESRPPCVVCLSFSHHSQISNVSRVPRQSFFVPASSRTFRVVSEIIWTGRVRSCSPLGHSPLYTVGGVSLLWVAVSPRYGNGRYSSIAGQWSSMSKPPPSPSPPPPHDREPRCKRTTSPEPATQQPSSDHEADKPAFGFLSTACLPLAATAVTEC